MSAVHSFRSLLHLLPNTTDPRDLVAFVLRNTPGATVDPDDIRTVQTAMYWWKKFGGDVSFPAYLERIPQAPDFAALRREFPQLNLPLLVDVRLGHVRTANLAGLKFAEYGYSDKTLEPFDPRRAIPNTDPYWVLAHDGTPNLNRRPSDCRNECIGRLFAGTVAVGIAIRMQYGDCSHVMDLPADVYSRDRSSTSLGMRIGSRTIAGVHDDARQYQGSVVFTPVHLLP